MQRYLGTRETFSQIKLKILTSKIWHEFEKYFLKMFPSYMFFGDLFTQLLMILNLWKAASRSIEKLMNEPTQDSNLTIEQVKRRRCSFIKSSFTRVTIAFMSKSKHINYANYNVAEHRPEHSAVRCVTKICTICK